MTPNDNRLQPTLLFDPNAVQLTQFVTDLNASSRSGLALQPGGQPRFSEETAELLRSRLSAASLLLAVLLGLGFPVVLEAEELKFIAIRSLVLLSLTAIYFLLRWRTTWGLRGLRRLEVLIFGLSAFQLAIVSFHSVHDASVHNDASVAVATKNSFVGLWSVFILTYGLFMPNSWRRAALIMLSAAALPHLLGWWARWWYPLIDRALAGDRLPTLIPLPWIAASVGIFGSHVINAIRREAFQARQFGQYRLTAKLGSGGMGDVYQAEHRLLKRPCAIKVIRAEQAGNDEALARFEREVQATAALSHWNTVEIFDYGRTDDGTFYYVMEFLPGLTLEALVDRYGPMPAARAIHFLLQVCAALGEAHGRGLVHRDIKPGNIFAAERGGIFDVAKLLDFGLVKDNRDGNAEHEHRIAGSPLYMAPEQAISYEAADARSDIYALGGVAYFLVTGHPPFTGSTYADVLRAHAELPVTAPSTHTAQLPADFEHVILHCLQKPPHERYADVEQLATALRSCACAETWTPAEARTWWQSQDKV